MREILQSYCLHLVPTVAIVLGAYLFYDGLTASSLVQLAFLFPMFLLATRGLQTHFPDRNLATRSKATMAEYAVLQGMVFSAFITSLNCILDVDHALQGHQLAISFLLCTALMAAYYFWSARTAQRRLGKGSCAEK